MIDIKSVITDHLLSLRIQHIVHSSKIKDIFEYATKYLNNFYMSER